MLPLGDVKSTSVHRETTAFPKVKVWCGFISPFFIEIQCPVNGWKRVTVNAQRYLTLLSENFVPCLREKRCTVTFMEDEATSHTAYPVKDFLIPMYGSFVVC
ncbi:hypothetical protein NPIL_66841 [Nephila pilipes]|uniref:Uncharacterized protein n=1 Tax=Nephila pilipes TaxID=299642 RepID=A0A8X6PLI6_NEPPI|nr:hypothetical protein NPIL_66841 [Nephila pilipes]